jgi:hypothetical protein
MTISRRHAVRGAKKANMSDSTGGGIRDQNTEAMQGVADGVQDATDKAHRAACAARGGVGEVRDVIRAQPITAALVVFTLGYLFGRLAALIPSRHSSTG